jgi:uncharacterized protein with von Willebrand factor type A (vWA) domain
MHIRYSAWTGHHEPFDGGLSAEDVLDELADDLFDGGDVSAALGRLMREGLAGRAGLDDLRRRVAEARARELSRMGLDGPEQRLDEALRPILDRERDAVDAAGDDPIAQARRDELDALPQDAFGKVTALRDSEWFDAQAEAEFQELLSQLRADVAQATFGQLAAGLQNLQPEDVERMREMLGELNDLTERHERGEDVDQDYQRFRERYRDQLSALGSDGPPAKFEDLLSELARRMAAMGALIAGMSAEQRAALASMAADALGDIGLQVEAERLRASLRRQFPQLSWSQPPVGAPQASPEATSLSGAVDWLERLEHMNELERALGQRYPGARLEDIDAAVLEDVLDSSAAADLRALREMERVLEQSGAVRRVRGRLELTPRGIRRLGERTLARIYQPARVGPAGMHATTVSGGDGELSGTTRELRFGDPFRLDVTRTVGNALRRRAGEGEVAHGRRVALQPDDFELAEAERRVQIVTALLLDMSFSMPLRGNWGPAKRVALALQALISSRFPQDRLVMIGFSDLARRLQPQDLLVAGWERVYGTNMEHAFALARREFERYPAAERQVIMITDGEPTAHLEGSRPLFSWPPAAKTLERTLREGRRLQRCGATLNVFLLDHDPGAGVFIERLVRQVGGRLLYPDLNDLGTVVVRDFLSRRGG